MQGFRNQLSSVWAKAKHAPQLLLHGENFGLRKRLVALVLLLLLFSMLVPGVLFYTQHRAHREASRQTIAASDLMIESIETRELLRNVHKQALRGAVDDAEFDELGRLARYHGGAVEQEILGYLELVSKPASISSAVLNSSFASAGRALGRAIDEQKAAVFEIADNQFRHESRILKTSLLVLVAAAILFMVIGYKIVSMVTEPVQSLIAFLDRVDLEDDLSKNALVSKSRMPEVLRLASVFDRFLERIRGYRLLNIRRLLTEKHRADLIAASILDGIFLIRGDELLYVNPVGEKILGLAPGSQHKFSISDFVEEKGDGIVNNAAIAKVAVNGKSMDTPNPAALKAILNAVSRTLPVEFSLEVEDRAFHYLLQARPVLEPTLTDDEDAIAGEIDESADFDSDMSASERARTVMMIVAQDVTLVRESQEAKSHFLATLSHEIKTPVTSLTMATRLLRKSVDQIPSPSHRSLITTCAEDVDRLRGLLGDLLSISSFDTLTQRLEIQNIDLGRLIKQSVQSFKPQARERGVELGCEVVLLEGKPIIAPVDPTKIAWAVSNLLTNGLRHTPRGGAVGMKVQVVDGKAEVRVRDTGPGIDRKRQSQIFEKFNSHYDIRVGRSGSAGVGLAIAREIVVAHQGRIWVASEPGKGAEFGFTLPLGRYGGEVTGGSTNPTGPDRSSSAPDSSSMSSPALLGQGDRLSERPRELPVRRTKGALSGAPVGC
ncbi:MAG: hypothetical protein A2X94_16710 [Bdellovibrionales bacterium GWB1_55_8]|nr:MAG: hypothetical protein A2X94_16710 [Bdellovibrionales bacterium GWB1_55_8]